MKGTKIKKTFEIRMAINSLITSYNTNFGNVKIIRINECFFSC